MDLEKKFYDWLLYDGEFPFYKQPMEEPEEFDE